MAQFFKFLMCGACIFFFSGRIFNLIIMDVSFYYKNTSICSQMFLSQQTRCPEIYWHTARLDQVQVREVGEK